MKKIIAILAAILMLATPATFSDEATMTVTVGNSAPTLDNIVIAGQDSGATVSPTAGNTTTVLLVAEARDSNGYVDISSVNCTITGTGTVEDSPVELSFDSNIDSTRANYTGTFNMDFYDASGTYTVDCVATDASAATGNLPENFNYDSLTALELDATTVGFGSVSSGATSNVTGDTSMATTALPTIQNYGNIVIDAKISGTALTGPATIPVGNVEYQFGTLGFSPLSGTLTLADINLTKGASETEKVDFELNVPEGTVTGTYNGTVTILAWGSS